MDRSKSHLELQMERIREGLKNLAKTHPKLAVEHPEVYRQFGMEKEAEKAARDYVKS